MALNVAQVEERFKQQFDQLNEHQQRAVNTIEGPVMVIAGPGTGKTQILATRIGKILLETDAGPENILCLTYTDAGVVAMRKRLLQFIGPDAYRVNIYTYHAFCNDVIQDNLSLFEKNILEPVSELEKIQLYKELIDSFQKGHVLKRYRGDVYFEMTNLEKLFSTMKREGWTPEFIIEKIDEYLASLPERDEYIAKRKTGNFNKGDVRTDKIADEKEKKEKLRAAVLEFSPFQQLMRRRNRYDFDDMINWVITVFENNKNVLAGYQEKYQYVLVDEFQDTSGTQNRLVDLLISFWDKPNVFVVGDDDQSIFRFQGANVENMLDFAQQYQDDLMTVVLQNNYRSTQPILDISKSLIGRNEERLVRKLEGLSKELISSNARINMLTHQPVIEEYESQFEEMIGITVAIEKLLAEGIQPGRIAVIYKENKYGEELALFMKQLGIPVFSKRHLNILEIPLARKILLMLKYLAAEHDTPSGGDEMLFELLHFSWFGIPALEIARLSMEVSAKRSPDIKMSIRQMLADKAAAPQRDLFTPGVNEKMRNASVVMEQLMLDVPNVTLQTLFEKLVRTTGVLNSIMTSEDKHWHLQVLTGLFNFIKDETRRIPSMDLRAFISLISTMEREDIKLPLVRVSGSDKGVNLLTAHGSKGLEFEYVFLAGCNAGSWEKKRKPGGGYTLPDNMFSSIGGANSIEELRRLFYVAITRAEQHLIISYSKYKNDGKEIEPSVFIAELREEIDLPIRTIIPDADVTDRFALLVLNEGLRPEIDAMEKEYIDRALEKFVMNVTALNNYLKCPLEFYFRTLVRIPSPKNEATEFGSSVHHALERLFSKMRDSDKEAFPSKTEFIGDFEWYMHRHRESFTLEEFNRRLEYGQEVLSNYYDKYINSFPKIVAIERRINNVIVNGVPLKGALDKLEFDGKAVNVVDYKTGDPDKGIAKLKGPSDKDLLGGDYWRQGVFYKILVDNYSQKDWRVVSTEFDFIEPDKKKNYRREKIFITPEDTRLVTQQITDTWKKIQAHDFYTGCGKEDCHWCNFVKTNELAIALHEIEGEPENSDDLEVI